MSFTATPVDGSATPIPMSSAVPDSTNTPLALEGGPSKSTGGNNLAPAAVYLYDGYDVTQGLQADAAVTGDNSGTISAKLRGLSKILNSVWDTTLNLLAVKVQAATAGGSTPFHAISAASTNSTNVKGSAGQIYGLSISNTNAAARFFKLYDKATAPTVGTDTPKRTIQIPANATVICAFPVGLSFASGIGFGATGAMADADATAIGAGDLSMDVDYK